MNIMCFIQRTVEKRAIRLSIQSLVFCCGSDVRLFHGLPSIKPYLSCVPFSKDLLRRSIKLLEITF